MTLKFDASKCKNPLPANDQEATVRETLVFLSTLHGFSEITEGNAPTIYARIHLIEQAQGVFLHLIESKGKRKDLPITPQDIQRWIGMTTNVSPIPEGKFLKHWGQSFLHDYEQEYRSEIK